MAERTFDVGVVFCVHNGFLCVGVGSSSGVDVHGIILHAEGGSDVRVIHAAPPSISLWTLSGVIRTECVE